MYAVAEALKFAVLRYKANLNLSPPVSKSASPSRSCFLKAVHIAWSIALNSPYYFKFLHCSGEGDGTGILGTPSVYSPRFLRPICSRA